MRTSLPIASQETPVEPGRHFSRASTRATVLLLFRLEGREEGCGASGDLAKGLLGYASVSLIIWIETLDTPCVFLALTHDSLHHDPIESTLHLTLLRYVKKYKHSPSSQGKTSSKHLSSQRFIPTTHVQAQ